MKPSHPVPTSVGQTASISPVAQQYPINLLSRQVRPSLVIKQVIEKKLREKANSRKPNYLHGGLEYDYPFEVVQGHVKDVYYLIAAQLAYEEALGHEFGMAPIPVHPLSQPRGPPGGFVSLPRHRQNMRIVVASLRYELRELEDQKKLSLQSRDLRKVATDGQKIENVKFLIEALEDPRVVNLVGDDEHNNDVRLERTWLTQPAGRSQYPAPPPARPSLQIRVRCPPMGNHYWAPGVAGSGQGDHSHATTKPSHATPGQLQPPKLYTWSSQIPYNPRLYGSQGGHGLEGNNSGGRPPQQRYGGPWLEAIKEVNPSKYDLPSRERK